MVMLSQLRRFGLVDAHMRHATFIDGAIALHGDHPPITRLLFHDAEKVLHVLPWTAVQAIDWHMRQLRVADLAAGHPMSSDALGQEVLLRRDILDALILDLQQRRATRANDLWLEEDQGQLCLRAVDTGVGAIWRRVSRGRYRLMTPRTLCDWKYVEFLRGDPHAVSRGIGYHRRIARLPPGEIAHLTHPLPYLHAAELIMLLPTPMAAETLAAMPPERQLQVFEELAEDEAVRLLTLMAPNLAADLVGRLPTLTMRRYLEALPRRQSERLIELLRYPEETVGGLMTNDVVFVEGGLTVAEAWHTLRSRLQGPAFVYLIYVVETAATRRLRGVISLRRLLTAEAAHRVDALMDPYVTTLYPLESAREAAYRVLNSHLAALPVVGHEGQLLGVVTVDAALAQVVPSRWRAHMPRIFT